MSIQTLREMLPKIPVNQQPFALSLIEQSSRRMLSDKQIYWVNKLIADATTPAPSPVSPVNVGNLTAINELFATARGHLKFPAIVMSVPAADRLVRINVAGPKAKHPGTLNVTSGEKPEYERRTWYGRVMKDGSYVPSKDAGPLAQAISERLKAFAADPAGIAAEHGKLTGRCCFCNIHLSDKRSTAVGYGKTCAAHYGLTWGTQQ
jgi:hypothetical protein